MRKGESIEIVVHYPTTPAGWRELSGRVAMVHADAVNAKLQSLQCPNWQKTKLLDAIIADAKAAIARENQNRGKLCGSREANLEQHKGNTSAG